MPIPHCHALTTARLTVDDRTPSCGARALTVGMYPAPIRRANSTATLTTISARLRFPDRTRGTIGLNAVDMTIDALVRSSPQLEQICEPAVIIVPQIGQA